MTLPPSPAPETRDRLRRIVTGTWLILVSASVLVNHVSLSHLTRETQDTAHSSEVETLQGKLFTVEQQLAAIKPLPNAVNPAEFTAARQALDDRLGRIEQTLGSGVRVNDLLVLQTRLEQVEARVEKIHWTLSPASGPARHRMPVATQPVVIDPPFALLGGELRGGEPFVSIAPTGSQSLSQVRVLHPGESEGDWLLEALDGKTATFRVNGQVRQITVP
jgi:hypothetical protein